MRRATCRLQTLIGHLVRSIPSDVTKTYPRRGPLQQFRFAESTSFACVRCGQGKKSKLITIYNGNQNRRICNGCYGRLLSLYEVKSGTSPEDERADDLAKALLETLASDQLRQAEHLFLASEERASYLAPESLRFLATAEHVASALNQEGNLEWSPAVIGLCKAVETELVNQLVLPLARKLEGVSLEQDCMDKDLSRLAMFCRNTTRKPPELGSIAHFLQTVGHSEDRRQYSATIKGFLELCADWKGANWILDPMGLASDISLLTKEYRNPAAHIDELDSSDYGRCKEHILGANGCLWRLRLAVSQ